MKASEVKKTPGSRDALAAALLRPRYEVIPLQGVEREVAEHVPEGVTLTVTASPSRGLEPTLDLTERLASRGLRVAPHLSARSIRDEGELGEILHRLHDVHVRDVFVVAGDAIEPAGRFESAVELLEAMDRLGHGMDEVGIPGYPESHPFIPDDVIVQAMWDKRRYATYIVSNICFDPAVISGWVSRVRRRGVELPIYVGMPGVVSRTKLMRVSRQIGLGESARFLRKYGDRLLRMFLPGGYSPDRLVRALEGPLGQPTNNIRGFHLYTFNEVEKTEAWRRRRLDNLKVVRHNYKSEIGGVAG